MSLMSILTQFLAYHFKCQKKQLGTSSIKRTDEKHVFLLTKHVKKNTWFLNEKKLLNNTFNPLCLLDRMVVRISFISHNNNQVINYSEKK